MGLGFFWDFLGLGFFGFFWVFLGFFGFFKFPNWDWVFLDWDFLGFFGFFKFPNWDWVFWVFLGLGFFGFFFGFSLYFLNLKLVLVFLTIIYGNIHNRVLASA